MGNQTQVESLRVLYNRYAGMVMAIALRIVRNRAVAEEIVPQVFYDLWKDLEDGSVTVGGPYAGPLPHALLSHARKLAIQRRDASPPDDGVSADLLRTAMEDDAHDGVDNELGDVSLSELPDLRWQREKTRAALSRVPADARRVMEMICLDALRPEDIARRLSLPHDKVRLLLLTGMHHFCEALKPPPATHWFDKSHFPLINLDQVRVLIVDDDADARRVLTQSLQMLGAFVTTACSAADALRLLPQINPEVLVSDLAMPDEDGFDLIRNIRRAGKTVRDLPAIALSAYATPQVRRQTMRAGFQMHIPKPVDPNHLAEVVATFAGRTG